MLKAVHTNKSLSTVQVLQSRIRTMEDEIFLLQVNKTIFGLVITACRNNAKNGELYDQLQEGYLTEREFIEALEDVSDSLRYQLAMAYLDAHNITGA